jgi:hydroxyacylglutathione hydrolase
MKMMLRGVTYDKGRLKHEERRETEKEFNTKAQRDEDTNGKCFVPSSLCVFALKNFVPLLLLYCSTSGVRRMLLRYFYDRELAQASYMVGCQDCGEAIVIDPSRDITPYLEAAQQEGVRIAHVTETHIHADFVSGARELAALGAKLYLSGEGGADWQYTYGDDKTVLLHEGDSIRVGNVRLDVLHTPGHTPEHLVFAVTDTATADEPLGLFTGDCLFVGDMGRPDLLETAAGVVGSKAAGAAGQFRNMQRLKALPDYLQVFPGHGAGSACGKALGAVPSSTLGYEKRFNPAFQHDDEAAFVAWLLADQPETPPYFAQMKRLNRDGAPLLRDLPAPAVLDAARLPELLAEGALVIDTRPNADFAAAHINGTVSIEQGDKFSTYAGDFIDYSRPYYLIADDDAMDTLMRSLHAIGADSVGGTFTPQSLTFDSALPSVRPAEAAQRLANGTRLIDVRGSSEYAERHIAGAHFVPLQFLARDLDSIPHDQPLIIQCASGARSQIAASYLRSKGYSDVANMQGGMTGWRMARLPTVEG